MFTYWCAHHADGHLISVMHMGFNLGLITQSYMHVATFAQASIKQSDYYQYS